MKLTIEKGIFWLSGRHAEVDKIKVICSKLENTVEAVIAADESDELEICIVLCYNSNMYIIEDIRWQYAKHKKEI